ncbi:hypothetical protein LKO27_05570 [Tessaracoccus sp. OS52]|uniref:hypothetical protein n=1 Tax=Tessaracoccus sp. OS52 TaxID=2886691 RepID=UPI001D12510C|nr:hypothetical protein [Tessaracoccus sp. OS52]MCC2592881.1 hypothetical protein [Tessaracoccus sp. OS52]
MSDNPHNQPGAPYGQQNPYGQPSPYGQPTQYGQQPTYPQQAPYGQPAQYPGQAPYGAYGPNGLYDEAPVERSGTLGVVGLVIVIVAAVALLICSWLLGQALSDLFLAIGQDPTAINSEELARDPRFQEFANQASGQWLIASLAVVGGLVGWIMSIVATATRRGRGFGIMGIVLGVLAPVLALITLTVAMWPAMVAFG